MWRGSEATERGEGVGRGYPRSHARDFFHKSVYKTCILEYPQMVFRVIKCCLKSRKYNKTSPLPEMSPHIPSALWNRICFEGWMRD